MWTLKLTYLLCSLFYHVSGYSANLTRIFNGQITQIELVPYQAQLVYNGQHICGGTVVSQNAILTAAHCYALSGVRPQDTIVRLGGNGLSDPRGMSFGVSAYHQHPQFHPRLLTNDVGVLILANAIPFNERIQSISLSSSSPRPGTIALASGWGLQENLQPSPYLKSVQVQVIRSEECQGVFDNSQFCTALGRSGTCEGDSGGPLVSNGELIGVVSFGAPHCIVPNINYYSGYSDVYVLRYFIDNVLQMY